MDTPIGLVRPSLSLNGLKSPNHLRFSLTPTSQRTINRPLTPVSRLSLPGTSSSSTVSRARTPTRLSLPGASSPCMQSYVEARKCSRRSSVDCDNRLLETRSTIDSEDRSGTKSPMAPGPYSRICIQDLEEIESLCQGQFSVTLAVDPATQIKVALKRSVNSDYEDEELIAAEIDVLLQLTSHPNIVELVGHCSPHALATEFCAGGNLSRILHDRPRKHTMSRREAVHLARHMCYAFSHIHASGFVHRDVKSGNLLLALGCADLTKDTLLVNDFGLSTREGEAWREAGTLRYAAPEVVVDRAVAHSSADIFALGCVFIELFGGVLPYHDCDSAAQIMAQIVVDCTGPEIPGNLLAPMHDLIVSMLSRDPRQRPTADEVLETIEKLG